MAKDKSDWAYAQDCQNLLGTYVTVMIFFMQICLKAAVLMYNTCQYKFKGFVRVCGLISIWPSLALGGM